MPMPDPTSDPGHDYGFFTPTLVRALAIVALVAAIIALAIALAALRRSQVKENPKKDVGQRQITAPDSLIVRDTSTPIAVAAVGVLAQPW